MSGNQKIARERNMTAREAAKKFGKSPRTIRRLVALDRDEYLKRAADKRQKVYDMRMSGCPWDEIAKAVKSTYHSVRSMYYQRVRELQDSTKKDTQTADLFGA
uniref:Probable plasmid replication protein n=1 Tax=Salmonella enteritidis TaxID=149539 RepID=E0A205_SALEN|nr:hypothetical protein [Salmonella enterica]ADK26052.1 probable plasmid replication protein [Salmonella enterica subsp. enterica serovar Enteritidis]